MTKNITELDTLIGGKIVRARKALGLTRKDLAYKLHITHQQLQKYENGINRISASRLNEVAKLLKVDITYFYNEKEKNVLKEEGAEYLSEQTEEIALLISRIKNKNKMDAVKNLIKSIITEEK